MKYKDSNTNTFKPIYVKAMDSMPVGTEVEFDGQASDIPVGWEQVDDKEVVLFSSTTGVKTDITLNDNVNNYDYIEIFFQDDNNVMDSKKVKYDPINPSFVLSTILNYGTSIEIDSKGYIVNINELNKLAVRSGRYTVTRLDNSVSNTQTDRIGIIKVIGHK